MHRLEAEQMYLKGWIGDAKSYQTQICKQWKHYSAVLLKLITSLLHQVNTFTTSQPMIYSTPSSVESEEYKQK